MGKAGSGVSFTYQLPTWLYVAHACLLTTSTTMSVRS
jgi:hypothetical protein